MNKDFIVFIKRIIIILIVAVLPVGMLNYVVDPLQLYRRAYTFDVSLYEEQRFQIPGFINSYQYDTVIVGTSMTENFLSEDIDDILDLEAIKLSISGASGYEQKLVIEKAIKTKKVKTVIWGIDFSSYRGGVKRTGLDENVFPFYLYDQNLFNDFKYLLNDKTTKRSINALIKYIKNGSKNEYINIEKYAYWDPYYDYGKDIMLKEAEKFKEKNLINKNEYIGKDILNSVEANIFEVIENNPEVEFILFYTPASLVREEYFMEMGIWDEEVEFRKHLSSGILSFENAKIHDFQIAKKIVANFEYYKDMSHYNVDINRLMLEYIKENKYKVEQHNLEDYNDIFNKLCMEYSIGEVK